jgi:hypothetical protein
MSLNYLSLDSVKTLHTRLIAPFYDVERISLASTVVKVKELNPDVGVYDSFLKVGKQR